VSQLRSDRLTDTWVIVAEERRGRPREFRVRADRREEPVDCPFCPGREAATPPEILALRETGPPDSPGWRTRVIPNKFPALGPLGNPVLQGFVERAMTGVGQHEVAVETPAHKERLRDRTRQQWADLAHVLQVRMRVLREDPRFRYVLAFKNQGPASGASLEHPHSQILAMPLVPDRVAREARAFEDYHRLNQRCLLEDLLLEELETNMRVLETTDDFVLVAPFAARFPYELLLAPRRHAPRFEDTPVDQLANFGGMLGRAFARLEAVLEGNPMESYHFALHTAPAHARGETYHWHCEVMPSLAFHAGLEKGSGMYLNHLGPERSAEQLRAVRL
jgi:UDPglucose--hexose-1-phosphate uridylyltransferase